MWAWGNSSSKLGIEHVSDDVTTPRRISGEDKWTAVSAGTHHSNAIREDGTLWEWGQFTVEHPGTAIYNVNYYTPTQVPQPYIRWRSIVATGIFNSFFISESGELYGSGRNSMGEVLGDGRYRPPPHYIRVPLRVEGTVNVESVHPYHGSTAALRSDGRIYTWGTNNWGQLGSNAWFTAPYLIPLGGPPAAASVAMGDDFMLATGRDDGSLWSWGRNQYGQLGYETVGSSEPTPTRIGTETDWKTVYASEFTSFALKTDGTLWTWGRDLLNENVVNPFPTRLGSGNDWESMSVMGTHVLAMKKDGTLWAYGNNNHGQLGDGTKVNRSDFVPVVFP